jgi:hypothetical protein
VVFLIAELRQYLFGLFVDLITEIGELIRDMRTEALMDHYVIALQELNALLD